MSADSDRQEVLLEYIKSAQGAIVVTNTSTRQSYYSILIEPSVDAIPIIKIFKPDQEKPFATVKADSIFISEGTGLDGLTARAAEDYLYKKHKWWKSKRFTLDGHEYKLRRVADEASEDKSIQLVDPSCHLGSPSGCIATFEPSHRSASGADNVQGCIRIAPAAVTSRDGSPATYTLIQKGQPTRVLDHALLASYIHWRADQAKARKKAK